MTPPLLLDFILLFCVYECLSVCLVPEEVVSSLHIGNSARVLGKTSDLN